MKMNKNKTYFLALNRIKNVGPRTVMKLLQRFPELEELFTLKTHELEQIGLKSSISSEISTFDFNLIDEDFIWEENANHKVLTIEDEEYPYLLKQIYDPPFVLYSAGKTDFLNNASLAIVGSRNPTSVGGENAYRFSRELAKIPLVIISGLALGVDKYAHKGAIDAGGKTIAVLGSGIDCIYPHRHLKLAEEIEEKGLLLSEFPLKTKPHALHFPRRNRIISGLSLATLVIEAAIKSGSLITARFALEQNRDVLAIPGSIHNPQSRGCNKLIRDGAKLVTSIDDVLNELSLEFQNNCKESATSLAKDVENLVKFIGFEVTSIDKIIERSSLSIEQVMSELAILELEGAITKVAGGYERCVK